MFDVAKKANKLRKMQADINKQLESISHVEKKGLNEVIVTASKKIEKLIIDGEERKDLKDLINEALKNVNKKAEKSMKDQSGELMEMLGL